MRVGTRVLQAKTVDWLRSALLGGRLTRSGIARELCERENWRNRMGQVCGASARKALPQLAEQLGLELPPSRPQPVRGPQAGQVEVPRPQFQGSLQALGRVRLVLVSTVPQRRLWRAMLQAQHPQGEARAPGKRLTYLLEAPTAGVLGGLSFVAAPMRLRARDKLIQWSPRARGANLERVLSNDRFLILEDVRVPNLASHVLSRAARQLRRDWKQRYGVEPLLLETYVNRRYRGTSYQSAGWKKRGKTAGRGDRGAPKAVWTRRLRRDWKGQLCREPARRLGQFPPLELEAGASWAERELGRSDMPDRRLRQRLVGLGAAWERAPGMALTAVFPKPAEQTAAYRFLENGRVTGEDMLHPHREALAERCREEGTVLLAQDTTTLNYTGLRACTSGLGTLGPKGSAGLHVHAAVAFTESGRPLGVSGLESWARSGPEGVRKKRARQKARQLREQRESRRWWRGFEQGTELGQVCPATRVIVVGDRESDLYGLFERQRRQDGQAGLLVRACKGRRPRVRVETQRNGVTRVRQRDLFAYMDDLEPLVRGRVVRIGSRGGKSSRAKRKAHTEIRMAQVQLRPPRRLPSAKPLQVWAVDVREENDSTAEEPLRWLLLSSDGGPVSAESADRIVGWYEARWLIEEFFRALKSGTRIKDRRLRSAEALRKCLVLDALSAWRTFDLCRARGWTPARRRVTT